jgi:hypothetical protein
MASFVASDKAVYSASVLESATVCCFLASQLIEQVAKINKLHFTFVRIGKLPALLPNATSLVGTEIFR